MVQPQHLNVVAPKAAGQGPAGAPPPTGSPAAMDRRIKKPLWKKPRLWVGVATVALLAALAGYVATTTGGGQTVRVAAERLVISQVAEGAFEDFIPVRGAIEPLTSVFVDAGEGGKVEQVLVEAGQQVRAGQPLVVLSNSQLELQVTSNEAQVVEQLNTVKEIEIRLEQQRLDNDRQLVQIDWQLTRLGREVGRMEQLVKTSAVARSQYEDALDELEYQRSLRNVVLETKDVTERMREVQLADLQAQTSQLASRLDLMRRSLDGLTLRAPVDGVLTFLDAEVGQNRTRGQQVGRIDRTDGFKVVAQIDEFYLTRLEAGQPATAEVALKPYDLRVAKIYPQVTDGQFRVDLEFVGAAPEGVRRGQTLQLRLQLGATSTALLLPNGAFYQDTGGDWVFVLDAAGDYATKRRVKLGRRNAQSIEVWEGLQPGERVVTSAYGDMVRMDRIQLQ